MPQDPPDVASPADALDPAARLAALTALGRIVLDAQPLGELLHRVVTIARQALPHADDISLTLIQDGRPRTAAVTGQVAAALDERQYAAGFGPCLDAAREGRTVRVDVGGDAPTYPEFERAAARAGVRSSLSVALSASPRVRGGLNIYTVTDRPVPDDAVPLAEDFARIAAAVVANATLYAAAAELVAQLERAMGSRAAIEQAKGALAAHLRISPDEAFDHLVAVSQKSNRKLRDVASETVQAAQIGRL